jgi:hypothetical protein
MSITRVLVASALIAFATAEMDAQQRSGGAGTAPAGRGQRRTGGTATLAIMVTDPSGAPLDRVKVTLEGPASRSSTTERGRLVFEGLPPGNYLLRFERDDLVTRERELTARGGPPIDVKVTMTPAPPPPKPPEPEPPPKAEPTVNAQPVTIDISNFIEKNFVGRAPDKTSALACSTGGPADLIQVREPLAHQPHPDADEYLYVVAGAGGVSIGGRQEVLQTGSFVLVPRGTAHAFAAKGRTPLVVLSIRAGDKCTAQ